VIDDFVAAFALTLARVGTFTYILPLLGGANIPRTVKIGLALALSMVFFTDASGTLAKAGGCGPLGLSNWLGFGLAVGREMILGGMLGFAMGLFLLPAHVAAEFLTQEGGLSFANVLTGSGEGSASSLTVLFEMLASVLFLGLDLHHGFLLVLQETFRLMPIGQVFLLPDWDMVTIVGSAQEEGVLLAAPVALCLFITTVVLALMTRAAPQLNLYSVGFPLRVFVFLGGILVILPQLVSGMVAMFSFYLDALKLAR
jgi:flagellar biosynthesis protein FliR